MSTEKKYEFKGTAGPWKPLHIHGLGQHWYSVTDDKGDDTQDIYWVVGLHEGCKNFNEKNAEKIANIHLVSAAPELLDACIETLKCLEFYSPDSFSPDKERLRIAIQKALNLNP